MATNTGRSKEAQEMAEAMDAVRDDIAALARSIGDLGREGRDTAEQELRKLLNDGAYEASRAQHALEAKFEDALACAERAVNERPVASLGIAAGIGLIAGLLLARR